MALISVDRTVVNGFKGSEKINWSILGSCSALQWRKHHWRAKYIQNHCISLVIL